MWCGIGPWPPWLLQEHAEMGHDASVCFWRRNLKPRRNPVEGYCVLLPPVGRNDAGIACNILDLDVRWTMAVAMH